MTSIEFYMNKVDWKEIKPEPVERLEDAELIPFVTYEGTLELNGAKINCVQLSDGQRLITEDGIKAFLRHLNGEIGRT